MNDDADHQPLLSPLLRWFMLAMVLANIAGGMYSSLLPLYLSELGAEVGQIGLAFTLVSAVTLVLQVLGGWISDQIGRLRAIALGAAGGVAGYFALLLAPTWQWLIVAMAMAQFPRALVGPSFGAFIAENSPLETRGRVYGLTGTIFQITGVIGPPLGGLLAGRYGFRLMLLVSALLYSGAAGLRIWMALSMRPPGETAPRRPTLAAFRNSMKALGGLALGGGIVSWILLTDGVRDIAFRLSSELQPLYLQHIGGLSLEQIGLVSAFSSGAMMLTPMLSGRLSDRHGERVPISAGFLLISLGYMAFLQAGSFMGFALAWMVFGSGIGMLRPAYRSLVSKVVPQRLLGTFSGLFRGSIGVVSLPAPWVGARMWERFGPRLPFLVTALAALLTAVPVWLRFRLPQPEPTPGAREMADT